MKNSIKIGFLEGFKFLIKPKGFLILFLYFILALLLVVSVLGIPLINVCRYNFTKKYLEAKKLETGFFFENLNSIDRYYTCFISKTFMLAKCIMKEFIILLLAVICFGIGTGIVYICYQKYGPSNGYIIVPMIFCFPPNRFNQRTDKEKIVFPTVFTSGHRPTSLLSRKVKQDKALGVQNVIW